MSALHRENLVGRHRRRWSTSITTASTVTSNAAITVVGTGRCRSRAFVSRWQSQLQRVVTAVMRAWLTSWLFLLMRWLWLLLLYMMMLLSGKQFTEHWHGLRSDHRARCADGRIRWIWTSAGTDCRQVLMRTMITLTSQKEICHLSSHCRRCVVGGGR